MKKEKNICTNLAVAPQTAKLMAKVGATCLVEMEKALHLYNKMF